MFITDATSLRLALLRSEVDESFIFERRPSSCEAEVEKPDAVRSRLPLDKLWVARTRTCLHQIGRTTILARGEVLRELNLLSDQHG